MERLAGPSREDRRPACLGLADLFFPENGASAEPAKKICGQCPLREWCEMRGIDEEWGVWGGVDRRQHPGRKAS